MSKHTWKLYALDKASGKLVWEQVAHEGIPRTKRHTKSSQASSTPATDGATVVAFFGSEGLYAYDFDGKLKWKQDLGKLNAGWFYDPDYEWGVASSPIIHRDRVIVQCDIQQNSFIAAFDLNTGKQLWRTERDEIPSWGTPTIYEGQGRIELVTHEQCGHERTEHDEGSLQIAVRNVAVERLSERRGDDKNCRQPTGLGNREVQLWDQEGQ